MIAVKEGLNPMMDKMSFRRQRRLEENERDETKIYFSKTEVLEKKFLPPP